MRKADWYLAATGLFSAALLGLLILQPGLGGEGARAARAENARLARELGLTDLCLFTESRSTRNPSQADRFTAFQDAPGALDLAPSGSLIPPPAHLLRPARP